MQEAKDREMGELQPQHGGWEHRCGRCLVWASACSLSQAGVAGCHRVGGSLKALEGAEKRCGLLHGGLPDPAAGLSRGVVWGVSRSGPPSPSPPQEMRNPHGRVSQQF